MEHFGANDYADGSSNPPRAFFFCVFKIFFPHQPYVLTPCRLKPATLRAWGVGQQLKFLWAYGIRWHIHDAYNYESLVGKGLIFTGQHNQGVESFLIQFLCESLLIFIAKTIIYVPPTIFPIALSSVLVEGSVGAWGSCY